MGRTATCSRCGRCSRSAGVVSSCACAVAPRRHEDPQRRCRRPDAHHRRSRSPPTSSDRPDRGRGAFRIRRSILDPPGSQPTTSATSTTSTSIGTAARSPCRPTSTSTTARSSARSRQGVRRRARRARQLPEHGPLDDLDAQHDLPRRGGETSGILRRLGAPLRDAQGAPRSAASSSRRATATCTSARGSSRRARARLADVNVKLRPAVGVLPHASRDHAARAALEGLRLRE